MKVQEKHGKVTQIMHVASRNYRYVWDVSTSPSLMPASPRVGKFWSRDGESIAQTWGRLKSLMLKCPNHELPKEIILTNFYARLSRRDKEMLDASSSGVFHTRSMEEKWDLIERIQKNTEDWEIDKGIEPAINYEHD